jgi:hypothetical protein
VTVVAANGARTYAPRARMVWFSHEPGDLQDVRVLRMVVQRPDAGHAALPVPALQGRHRPGRQRGAEQPARSGCGWAPQYDGQTNEDGTAVEEFEEEVEDGMAAQVLPDAEQ